MFHMKRNQIFKVYNFSYLLHFDFIYYYYFNHSLHYQRLMTTTAKYSTTQDWKQQKLQPFTITDHWRVRVSIICADGASHGHWGKEYLLFFFFFLSFFLFFFVFFLTSLMLLFLFLTGTIFIRMRRISHENFYSCSVYFFVVGLVIFSISIDVSILLAVVIILCRNYYFTCSNLQAMCCALVSLFIYALSWCIMGSEVYCIILAVIGQDRYFFLENCMLPIFYVMGILAGSLGMCGIVVYGGSNGDE